MIPDKLLKIAFDKIDSLETGQVLRNTDVKNWDVFIDCAKQYFDCFRTIRFNKDYSAIKKVNRILTYQETINTFKTPKNENERANQN